MESISTLPFSPHSYKLPSHEMKPSSSTRTKCDTLVEPLLPIEEEEEEIVVINWIYN